MTESKKALIGASILGIIILIFMIGSTPTSETKPSQPFEQNGRITVPTTDPAKTNLLEANLAETGTQSRCHPSYSGCLNPNASDYDCLGGSGNGPYYTGKVRVIGPDVFGLDRDRDGWGCE